MSRWRARQRRDTMTLVSLTRRIIPPLVAVLAAAPGGAADEILPWQVWRDPAIVARVPEGVRTVHSTSHSPEGSKYDRHSPDSPRFIRTVGDEGVIFEARGAGAVTRIWMTQGNGVSRPLDPSLGIRITVDGAEEPVVDMPAAALFAGGTEPFVSPLVLDRTQSAGGFVSLVPIPFGTACRVSLVGAEDATVWYHVTAVLVEDGDTVESFTADADLHGWRRMLSNPGRDPWPRRGWPTVSGTARLLAGETGRLADLAGPDQITGLVLRAPANRWPDLRLRLRFDGADAVDLPVTWFFGVAGPGCAPVRSLFIGAAEGDLYSYFPMPFFERATVDVSLSPTAAAALDLEYAVRRAGAAPSADAGLFRSGPIDAESDRPGEPAQLIDLAGHGRLAGVAVTAGLADSRRWAFLEGDESIVIDGETEPSWRGTGVEDFFGGGFYFRDADRTIAPFRRALHGLTCVGDRGDRRSTSLYRLMPTDGPFFSRSLEFFEEGGPTGELRVRWRGVYWGYLRPSRAPSAP
jgi:hypothetical protein